MVEEVATAPVASTQRGKTDEYAGLSTEQQAVMRRHFNALEVSTDYVRPYFDRFIRMDELYHGVVPSELDCTFSKVMLRIPFSTVQNELPRSAASLFSGDDFFQLVANDKEMESAADAARFWLNDTARRRNRIYPRILPTLTRVGIYGTGYRIVTHTPITKHKSVRQPRGMFAGVPSDFETVNEEMTQLGIVSQNIDIWNGLPAPNGGMANCLDPEAGEAVEWFHWIDYVSDTKLKAMRAKRFANGEAITRMMAAPKSQTPGSEYAIDIEYREKSKAASSDQTTSDWIERLRMEKKEGIEGRHRCVWTFFRDRWILVGEGRFLLYDGPPLLDWFPVAKYVDTPDLDNWFGTGLLETCEDIILAYLLTFNFRMDYLATTLHPTKFVRDDIVKTNGGNLVDFDPTPYGMFQFPRKIQDIQRAIWYDRFPELSPQAFMEETSFKQLLQEITAQPNYMKGMGGAGTLANETATGIVSLIEEGTARSSLRALNLEYIGLHDELMLMLKWGKKYIWEDQEVRNLTAPDGWPWMLVPQNSIDDSYGIELMGTRSLIHKNEMVKRMMSILPMLVNNPNVPGQRELLREVMKSVDVFRNPDSILGPANPAPPMLGAGGAPGMGGTPTVQNQGRSMAAAMPGRTSPAFAV